MILRMIHDEHGATHVYDHTQLNLHLERGWKVDPNASENEWYLPAASELLEKQPPKRGRPFKK
jgi:hypothetical protein